MPGALGQRAAVELLVAGLYYAGFEVEIVASAERPSLLATHGVAPVEIPLEATETGGEYAEFDVIGRPTALIALARQSRCLERGAERSPKMSPENRPKSLTSF